MPLKNRSVQIPQGLTFLQPETSWRPIRFSSFDSIVDQVIEHRRANPHLIEKNGWSVDRNTVVTEVDNFNTKVCVQMGWLDYIEGGGPVAIPFRPQDPLHPQSLSGSLANVAAGSGAIVEFVANRQEAVPDDLATARAVICSGCPLNTKGNWLSRFTVPVANAIRIRLQDRAGMNLSTPHDALLGVCEACECPLPLMIHFPIQTKLRHLTGRAHAALDPRCWVLAEESNLKQSPNQK